MLTNLMANRVAFGVFGLAALFWGLVGWVDLEVLIILLAEWWRSSSPTIA